MAKERQREALEHLEWRPIPGFPCHEVSEFGHVRRSVAGGSPAAWKGRVLKASGWGRYRRMCLSWDSKSKWMSVHRLVLLAFVGPPPSEKHQAAHNDGNEENNHYSNLRWATAKENAADKIKHGTQLFGADSQASKYQQSQIDAIRELASRGIPHSLIAGVLNTSQSHVSRIVRKENWGKQCRLA